MVREEVVKRPPATLKGVVRAIGWASSSFFWRSVQEKRKPGPARRSVDEDLAEVVRNTALKFPFWGYKRIAVVVRRAGVAVSNRFVYVVLRAANLLQKKSVRHAELYQAAKLFELLPQRPNDLWQADVTYIHIPGNGWWYAVTVIDYYSRYLLALHLTPSYAAASIIDGLSKAITEAERLHGKLARPPILVTDNGSSFLAKRFQGFLSGKMSQVRTRYRTPEQLGLLERFHRTLKHEEIYWNLYSSVADAREKLAAFHVRYNEVRPHWALQPVEGGDPVTPQEVYTGQVVIQVPRWQAWAVEAKKKIEEQLGVSAGGGKIAA
jgi:putative transposase